jgi:hypothetical protein
MAAPKAASVVPLEVIERAIYVIRGQKVMLDSDLARLYGVTTGNLNKAVSRNASRFPADFAFRLNAEETKALMFQIGISKSGRGGRRTLPMVFTEQGVAMLSSVLNSERAVQVNIAVIRTFVRLREMLSANRALAAKLAALERKITGHDEAIQNLFDAIRAMLADPPGPRRPIGFNREHEKP